MTDPSARPRPSASDSLRLAEPRNVIVAESDPATVLAAVSLARRLGGADFVFVRRDLPGLLFEMPAHAKREKPYRLIFLGLDAPKPDLAAKIDADPAESVWWIEGNEDSVEDEKAIRERLRGGGQWFHAAVTHHPFPAIEPAVAALKLTPDPFSETLLAIAEARLSKEDEAAFGGPWRDALAALASRPIELISAVKPLVSGMPKEIGEYEILEGSALRKEVIALVDGSTLIRLPLTIGPTVLLMQPAPDRLHNETLADTAIERTRAEIAVCLYDVGDIAVLHGKRRGAEPPVSIAKALEKARRIPWVRVDRVKPGAAILRFHDAPKEAQRAFVAALG